MASTMVVAEFTYMINPFLKRSEKKAEQSKAYWRSKKQEKELGKRLGANLVPGSGKGNKKGDLFINGVARVEAKSTSKLSFNLTIDMIGKIEAAGRASGEVPAIVVEFLDEQGRPYMEVAVVQTSVLEELIYAVNNPPATGSR